MTVANPDAIDSSSAPATASGRRRAKLASVASEVCSEYCASAVPPEVAKPSESPAVVTLANALLQLDIVPALGGGISRFEWCGKGKGNGDAPTPIFRGCPDASAQTDPNELACYPLVPYSNRIGGGRFRFGGREFEVPRNRASEQLPIHGDGWLSPWRLVRHDALSATLALDHGAGKPYTYRAKLTYALDAATLVVTLSVENAGRTALPFGLGLHPFLRRDAGTELSAAAGGLWLSDDDWLPVRHVPVPPAWQFGVAYPLSQAMVNHAFTHWSGRATVVWPNERLALTIDSNTECYVLYTPPGEDFFCFEPVDHPINALNLQGGGVEHGMTVLAPGERLEREFRFTVEPVA
jgi:aldose 1-epimerase